MVMLPRRYFVFFLVFVILTVLHYWTYYLRVLNDNGKSSIRLLSQEAFRKIKSATAPPRDIVQDNVLPYLETTATSGQVHHIRFGFNYRQRFPKVIGIGVKKCGTTALIRFLSLHPDIVIPEQPELHFFDMKYERGFEYYRSLMPYTAEQEITFEKTPRYFVLPEVPEKIQQLNPKMKLILIVCDPIRRAYSDFNYEVKRKGKLADMKNKSKNVEFTFDIFIDIVMKKLLTIKDSVSSKYRFEQNILHSWSNYSNHDLTILTTGMYSVYFKHWLKHFPMKQINVVNGEELLRNPAKVLKNVQQFMGIDVKVDERDMYYSERKGYYCMKRKSGKSVECLDKAKGTTRGKLLEELMSIDTLKMLREFYRPYNDEFLKLTENT